MKKRKIVAIVLTLCNVLAVAGVTVKSISTEKTLAEPAGVYTPILSSNTNAEIPLLSGDIFEFSKAYKIATVNKYLPDNFSKANPVRPDDYAPTPATITWESTENAQYYCVRLSKKRDMSEYTQYFTPSNSLTVEDLFMGTRYYYQVYAIFADKTVKSRVFEFKTAYLPRTIEVAGVSNTRDFGGYYTEDKTKRVKQGMIYRGAHMDAITETGKEKMRTVYGIKTDVDMRGDDLAYSPLGSDVHFVNVSGPYYVSENTGIISTKDSSRNQWHGTYRDALKEEIKAFANPENYPIYIHCSLGRDRTGTLAFLINALLGVGKNELFMDYELSFFSQAGCADGNHIGMVTDPFTSLYSYINTYPTTGTLAEKTEKFMLDLGITQTEIDSIRSILLEEVTE